MKIVDNVLTDYQCDSIFNTVTTYGFPYYYSNNLNGKDYLGNYYFTYFLMDEFEIKDDKWLPIFIPLMNRFSVPLEKVRRLKVNLHPRVQFRDKHQPHTDYPPDSELTTYLYYANTCNGYTGFKNKKIESKRNRMVIFDGSIPHYSTNCTDTNARISINFDARSV